jgi:hypothetical protein
MGAVQLFCALMVAAGVTFARTRSGKTFADFKAFLLELVQSALCAGLQVVHLMLDNGSTHAPKQLGRGIASLALSFEVRLYWLPTHTSGLDQVDLIFSKVQRDVLTPNDFPSTLALEKHLKHYCDELNRHPKPIQWTYAKTKLLAKFGAPQPVELAAQFLRAVLSWVGIEGLLNLLPLCPRGRPVVDRDAVLIFPILQMLVNPLLLVEVLSASTEGYDRGFKFTAYQSIAGFQEYVLVTQDRPHITRYVRQADGQWLRSEVEGRGGVLQLVSVPCALALSDVYRFINFPPLED